ncbi:MAG: Rdx family protein [Dehalococcoidia bacterium]|nr:Rdx family protein [Dehalococcoidia bacterium]
MANEFFQAFGPDAAIALTPKGNGRLEVYLDGQKIFDKKEEDKFPDLAKVRELKGLVRDRLGAMPAAAND